MTFKGFHTVNKENKEIQAVKKTENFKNLTYDSSTIVS